MHRGGSMMAVNFKGTQNTKELRMSEQPIRKHGHTQFFIEGEGLHPTRCLRHAWNDGAEGGRRHGARPRLRSMRPAPSGSADCFPDLEIPAGRRRTDCTWPGPGGPVRAGGRRLADPWRVHLPGPVRGSRHHVRPDRRDPDGSLDPDEIEQGRSLRWSSTAFTVADRPTHPNSTTPIRCT